MKLGVDLDTVSENNDVNTSVKLCVLCAVWCPLRVLRAGIFISPPSRIEEKFMWLQRYLSTF